MTEIQSRSNPKLRHLLRLGREKKYRRETGEMLCEGEKMLGEALASGAEIKTVLIRGRKQGGTLGPLAEEAGKRGAALYTADGALFLGASQVEAPQDVVFSCKQPEWGKDALSGVSQVLLLEGIQDPGNLGTILRTAEAFALEAVVLCEGCADMYSPKVVRSTMGAVFRLPCVSLPLEEAARILKGAGLKIYAAAVHGSSISIFDAKLAHAAVIIGSEGRGVSETAAKLSDDRIIIPMRGRAESLNAGVAASIVIYEMTKQEERKCLSV